jgi:hypothetical protein
LRDPASELPFVRAPMFPGVEIVPGRSALETNKNIE